MCKYSILSDIPDELFEAKPYKVPRRFHINQNKRCKGCSRKGLLYLTKLTNVAFCYACLKADKNVKIRASLCTRCGQQKRTRRLPLHPPKKNSCLRCSWDMPTLTTSFKSIIVILMIGGILGLAYRHRYTGEIGSVTSVTFWLLVLSGALGSYFATLMLEERFHRSINKELIHAIIWGGGIGLAFWITGIFFTSNFLTWIICLFGGALAGVLFAVVKRAGQYLDSYK